MIEHLKPYQVTRRSGLPWLGTIPEHWDMRRLKYLLCERDSRSKAGDERLLRVSQYTGVTERAERAGRAGRDGVEQDTRAATLVGYKIVSPGDLVVNIMLAWNGSLGISRFSGITSPAYCVYRFGPSALAWYYHYLLRSETYATQIKAASTGVVESRLRLYTDNLYRLPALRPPLEEQSAIARFLLHIDRHIGRAIRAKQQLIALCNEQRRVVIRDMLTRGVDPSAGFKSSDLVGVTPEHWCVGRLSQFFTLQRGHDITKSQQREGAVPVVSSGGIASYHDVATSDGPGVLVGRKGTAGSVHYIESQYWAHDTTLWVNDFKGNYPKFVYFLLLNLDLKRFDTGSSNPTLNRNLIHPVHIAVPPTSEQQEIARAIETSLARMDLSATAAQREVALLREFRTRLVVDVVTGKVDVRDAAARLPEADSGPDGFEDAEDGLDALKDRLEEIEA